MPDPLLERVLEAGRFAPSQGNCQPWAFLVITDRQLITRMSEACAARCRPLADLYVRRGPGRGSRLRRAAVNALSRLSPNHLDQRLAHGIDAIVSTDGYDLFLHAPAVIVVLGGSARHQRARRRLHAGGPQHGARRALAGPGHLLRRLRQDAGLGARAEGRARHRAPVARHDVDRDRLAEAAHRSRRGARAPAGAVVPAERGGRTPMKEYPFRSRFVGSRGSACTTWTRAAARRCCSCTATRRGRTSGATRSRASRATTAASRSIHLGFGFSDKPRRGDYSMRAHIMRLDAFVERLDLRDVTLVAQDWGGIIGLGWAVHHRARVRRLVIVNSAGCAPPGPRGLSTMRPIRGR
ncbi:MAG: alpha/beta fold hydrolase [Sandaracinaceae bacterium]|nr:alpha/beta fold hydrolase [Sandaracinaceae bacterium]